MNTRFNASLSPATLALLVMLVCHLAAFSKEPPIRNINSVLREPLAPEALHLSRGKQELVIKGPTFSYRVQTKTGALSGIRVVRGRQEVISSSGPAQILIDQKPLLSSSNPCTVSVVSEGRDKVVIEARSSTPGAGPAPAMNFKILHTFFNDGMVVSEIKLIPRVDLEVKSALQWQVPARGQFNSYLHKRRDENGEQAARGKLPASGAVRFSTLTSCLSVVSPMAALAIFTDGGAAHLSLAGLDTAVVEMTGQGAGVVLSQYLVHVAPGDPPYLLKAGEEFVFRVGLSVAPNRLEHPRTHDLRMFIWIGDAKYPYPSDEEISDVARWGYTLFQLHRVGTLGEPRPPAGELERVIRKVHELGMLFIAEENADLLYDKAPGVQELKTKGQWNLWQGFNYGGRYTATMDPYCDLAATCLASPNGLAEYRLANIGRMLDRFDVDGIYLDDNLAYSNCTLWKEHQHPRQIYDCLIELHEVNWRRRELLRSRVPHAVLLSHNTKAFVLPILADFDVQYFAEGYCFESAADYWDNYRAWSLSMNAQAMICPGDDWGGRCTAALACNYDLLTGGGQYSQMDWRLFPNKFNYATGVTARELDYCKTYNLAQYYFGLFAARPFYFANSTNFFSTTSPLTYATVYQNQQSAGWLLALANFDSKDQATSLIFHSPKTLGILPNKRYFLFDVHQHTVTPFAGSEIARVFSQLAIPGQNLQLYTLKESAGDAPCHLWGGQKLSEVWDRRKRKLAFEIQGPPGLQETVYLWGAKPGVEKILVAGQPAAFSFDPRQNLVHGPVTFTHEPLRIEAFWAADQINRLPEVPVQDDPIVSGH